jgi:hypothetical protein
MKNSLARLAVIAAFNSVVFAQGCGTKTGDVTLKSDPLSSSVQLFSEHALSGGFFANAVTSSDTLQFCITQVKLENHEGKAQTKDGQESIEFKPGLISLAGSNAGNTVTWGSMNIPTGFKIGKLKVEVHKDQELCPTLGEYSVVYDINGKSLQTDKDVEFKFKFNANPEINAGDTIRITLGNIVSAMAQASSGEDLKNKAEEIEESGAKD